MLLLQGGTQSDLRSDGELVAPISEQGASVYVLTSGLAKGYCTLTNTISADLTSKGLYICTSTQIYFLPRADINGDSTASLQLLSITPPNNITRLCAEKSFLVFISTSDITVTNLETLVSRTLPLPNLVFLASYRSYIAFATVTRVYTFCTQAEIFSLANCYTPVEIPSGSYTMTLVHKLKTYLKVITENCIFTGVYYTHYRSHALTYFGSFIKYSRMYLSDSYRSITTDWQGFSVRSGILKYVGLDFLDKFLYERVSISPEPAPVVARPGYWDHYPDLYKLSTTGAIQDLKLELLDDEFDLSITITTVGSNQQPDAAVYAAVTSAGTGEGPITTSYYFTLPDESYNSFIKTTVVGQIITPDKLYGWVAYFHHKDSDGSGIYSEPRLVLCIFNRNTQAVSCATDTFRSGVIPYIPEDSSYSLTSFMSDVKPFKDQFVFADKRSDTAAWTASELFRKIVTFTVDDTTDTFAVTSETDLTYGLTELQTCILYTADTMLCAVVYNAYNTVYRITTPEPILYNITSIALGPGLAIADNGVGIHYMGLAGHWKRLFIETEEIKSMDIGNSDENGDKLAYATATFSKVIDI